MNEIFPLYYSSNLENIEYQDLYGNSRIEEWKDIEGIYQISDLGRVKVLTRSLKHRREGFVAIRKPKIKKPYLNINGYFYINLIGIRFSKRMSLHRLVALHFIPNPSRKREVNHKDGDKTNNIKSNLEWNTPVENTQNTFFVGHPSKRVKLSFGEAYKIKELYNSSDLSYSKIGEMYGVNKSAIRDIIKNKSWNFQTKNI